MSSVLSLTSSESIGPTRQQNWLQRHSKTTRGNQKRSSSSTTKKVGAYQAQLGVIGELQIWRLSHPSWTARVWKGAEQSSKTVISVPKKNNIILTRSSHPPLTADIGRILHQTSTWHIAPPRCKLRQRRIPLQLRNTNWNPAKGHLRRHQQLSSWEETGIPVNSMHIPNYCTHGPHYLKQPVPHKIGTPLRLSLFPMWKTRSNKPSPQM